MMGPEPMTSTERRSSRLGIARPSHQGTERVELGRRVVWPRRGLRVVLHAERGRVEQPDALHHAVIEVDVADLRAPERRVKGAKRVFIMVNEGAVPPRLRCLPAVVAGRAFGAGG